jgi:starvation-inducible DNA-binding protein
MTHSAKQNETRRSFLGRSVRVSSLRMQSKPDVGAKGNARDSLARVLEHVLREEGVLLAATCDYRWKVTGPNLYSLHRLFDEQRRQLDYWVACVMERTKSLGLRSRRLSGKPVVSVREPGSDPVVPARTMIGDLLSRHEHMAQRLRDHLERLRDPVATDLLQRLLEFHETTAWMLRVVGNGSDSEPAPG